LENRIKSERSLNNVRFKRSLHNDSEFRRCAEIRVTLTIARFADALDKNPKEPYICVSGSKCFSVAHYSGTVLYQLQDVFEKNRDFLAPEVVETMRMSKDNVIKDLFTNRLTRSGNLTMNREKTLLVKTKNNKISRWGAALMAEKQPIRVRGRETIVA